MIRIRAFRAINDIEACNKFAEGHSKVLQLYGVTQVTSANLDWITNPSVYVILAESVEENKVVGGARIHLPGNYPLPIEKAVFDLDKTIFDLIKQHALTGTGELCGLWNSKEVAGLGIGSIYLMRAGISITNQLNLKSLFALCASHTLNISLSKGFTIEKSLGKDGVFYYPKEDLIATALVMDPNTIPSANIIERENIFDLRSNPIQRRKEGIPPKQLEIEYDLIIKND